jgi:hypothetical protein
MLFFRGIARGGFHIAGRQAGWRFDVSASEQRATERRVHVTPLRYPELRTGFDRRRRSPVLEFLRDNQRVLIAMLVALNLLSLADWALTVNALTVGASEGNVVLAALMQQNMLLAGVFKFSVMLGVSLLVWRARSYRLVLATLVGALGLYLAVIVYHVSGLAIIGVL